MPRCLAGTDVPSSNDASTSQKGSSSVAAMARALLKRQARPRSLWQSTADLSVSKVTAASSTGDARREG